MFFEANYIKSVRNIEDQPERLPQILLLGRSNVGKSSFINSLTNRKNLARISNTPGKTVLLNFYLINKAFYLVDAPGYGYAKRSKKDQEEFLKMIKEFLVKSKDLKLVCLLIDFKVGPTKDDLLMYQYLKTLPYELLICATKLDKIPKTKQFRQEKTIKEQLGFPKNFISISNTDKININSVVTFFLNKIGEGIDE